MTWSFHLPARIYRYNTAPNTSDIQRSLHPMLAETAPKDGHTPKLRTACENCRQSKVKCNLSGKNMCIRCLRQGLQCRYGYANRSGKPKGSKNRATLRKMGLPDTRRKCEELSHMNYGEESMGDQVGYSDVFERTF